MYLRKHYGGLYDRERSRRGEAVIILPERRADFRPDVHANSQADQSHHETESAADDDPAAMVV